MDHDQALDPDVLSVVARSARLFLAQWEPETPIGKRCDEILLAAAAQGDEDISTRFYHLAFQDPLLRDAFRRAVRTAVYLEWEKEP